MAEEIGLLVGHVIALPRPDAVANCERVTFAQAFKVVGTALVKQRSNKLSRFIARGRLAFLNHDDIGYAKP